MWFGGIEVGVAVGIQVRGKIRGGGAGEIQSAYRIKQIIYIYGIERH